MIRTHVYVACNSDRCKKTEIPETIKQDWTREMLKEFVENTLKTPPGEAVYIIGEQTFPYAELNLG